MSLHASFFFRLSKSCSNPKLIYGFHEVETGDCFSDVGRRLDRHARDFFISRSDEWGCRVRRGGVLVIDGEFAEVEDAGGEHGVDSSVG